MKKSAGALFILILALVVLRPTLRSLAKMGGDKNPGADKNLTSPLSPDMLSGPGKISAAEILLLKQQQLESLKQMVSQDPSRVAQVLKTWVGE